MLFGLDVRVYFNIYISGAERGGRVSNFRLIRTAKTGISDGDSFDVARFVKANGDRTRRSFIRFRSPLADELWL